MDVVVVEDHRGGHAGQQPAHLGVGPRVAVEPDVLVEADDLVVGPVRVAVASPGDAAAVLRGQLVGVDLVAEQQQRVGPLLRRLSRHPRGVGVERVDAELAGLLGDDDLRVAARPEDDPVPAGRRRAAGADDAARGSGDTGGGQTALAVDQHLVGIAGVRFEPGDGHDGVVVPAHLEGARAGSPARRRSRPGRAAPTPTRWSPRRAAAPARGRGSSRHRRAPRNTQRGSRMPRGGVPRMLTARGQPAVPGLRRGLRRFGGSRAARPGQAPLGFARHGVHGHLLCCAQSPRFSR